MSRHIFFEIGGGGWFGGEICKKCSYLGFGVDGESFKAFVIKLKITTTRQSNIGPKIAPCHPSKNIPPAIDKPVK